jgi:hypothetical protein
MVSGVRRRLSRRIPIWSTRCCAGFIATGRCRWQDLASPPLNWGCRAMAASPGGSARMAAKRSRIELDDGSVVPLPCASPWYVDAA